MTAYRYFSADGCALRTLHFDPDRPGRIVQETTLVYDDAFVQRNRELGEHQTGPMKLIARGVPLFVWEQSEREGWDDADWAKWLNDPDNAAFRVWRGSV
jgi:hypothetical protein